MPYTDPIEIQLKNIRRGSTSHSFDLSAYLSEAWSMEIVDPRSGRVYFENHPGGQNATVRARNVRVGTSRPQMIFHRHQVKRDGRGEYIVPEDSLFAIIELRDTVPRIVSSNEHIRLRP